MVVIKAKYGEYFIENNLVPYCNLIAKRVTQKAPKFDYPMIIDGYEGYGKSNLGVGVANYLAQLTNRDFSLDNILFHPKEMLELSLKTKENILMLDESALSLLASDRKGGSFQLEIIKMLNVARKKRHIMFFCIPRFWRLKENIIERCMGMLHVYSKSEKEYFRFRFHKKSQLEWLYERWKKSKLKPNYAKKFAMRGSFAEALPKVVDEEAYDKKKDEAMLGIIENLDKNPKDKSEKPKSSDIRDILLKKAVLYLQSKRLGTNFAETCNVSRKTLYDYSRLEVTPSQKKVSPSEIEEAYAIPA